MMPSSTIGFRSTRDLCAAILACGLLSAGGVAHAQGAAPAPSAAEPGAFLEARPDGSLPGDVAASSDAKAALIERFIALPAVQKSSMGVVTEVYSPAALQRAYPDLDVSGAERLAAIYAEELREAVLTQLDAVRVTMNETFTETEIEAMIRLYSDPGIVSAIDKLARFEEGVQRRTGDAYAKALDAANARAFDEALYFDGVLPDYQPNRDPIDGLSITD